ncbi:MAG TPA: cytochrome c [Candidatus Binataceae bacterium]|nr:cytochrome c [Candidatus Binataceae bacterium]
MAGVMGRAAARVFFMLAPLAILVFLGSLAAFAQTAAKPAHAGAIEAGHSLFNSQCAHCHGEDAGAEDPYYNLPQLLADQNDKFFFDTVSNGMPDKGMPPWKTVLTHRDIGDLLAYLRSLEREQGLLDNQAPH